MEWTMPRPVLQGVASLLALGAMSAFAMGVINAPERGRFPGERAPGAAATPGSAINAPEATPLSQERIEAPPKPAVEKPATNTDETDQSDEADTGAVNATAPVVNAMNAMPPSGATNATPATPPDVNASPPQEEPPH